MVEHRHLVVVGRPTTLTATGTNTPVTASRPRMRQRPARPSDRFLTIFMKSSEKPMAPHARVTNSTSIASVLRLERITNGSAVASR